MTAASPSCVIVSGLDAGPRPSAGVGVARSLKAYRSDLRIVGIDYSPLSSGLHTALFDQVIEFPGWSELDLEAWKARLSHSLDQLDGVLISGLDTEIRLLAAHVGGDSRILSPGSRALEVARRPPTVGASLLGLGRPGHLMSRDPREIDRFLRASVWGVWIRNQSQDAVRATDAEMVLSVGRSLGNAGGDSWYLEQHVRGEECSVAFVAIDGRLIDAAFMRRMAANKQGDTWSGRIEPVEPSLLEHLADLVDHTCWTGAGTIEMIHDSNGDLYLLELKPRFPGWVHGATVCGINLPAALISGRPCRTESASTGFERITEEIPLATDHGHSLLAGYQPGSTTRLAESSPAREVPIVDPERSGDGSGDSPAVNEFDAFFIKTLGHLHDHELGATPMIHFAPETVEHQITELQRSVETIGNFSIGYSIKTCPVPSLLRLASGLGLRAEAITQDELAAALRCGFTAESAILNGPAKWWPEADEVTCYAFFADSLEELRWLAEGGGPSLIRTQIAGVRLAATGIETRFGVRLDKPERFAELTATLAELNRRLDADWAISLHIPQYLKGTPLWIDQVKAKLREAEAMASILGVAPRAVDLGGGWHVDDFDVMIAAFEQVVELGSSLLAGSEIEWILEPGKLIVEPAGVLITRVIGRREDDLVLDAGFADAPETLLWFHPVAVRTAGNTWHVVPPGENSLLGRSCMERDIPARNLDLSGVSVGDLVAVGNCGAYNTSTAYPFGRGYRHTEGVQEGCP